jgi:hypothetical protein
MTRAEMIEAIYRLKRGEGRERDQIKTIKALD